MIPPASTPLNPFPGLRPFREDEEHLFFGRETQIDAMVDKLADKHFVAVVGTSGSGKSSLVNCGLRPALRQGLMARAGTAWRMAQFRPGNDPIAAMARALAKDGVLFDSYTAEGLTLEDIIETTLRMSKVGLIDIWEQAALDDDVRLLVVVDQFEELFRYRRMGADGGRGEYNVSEQATAFVNLLLEAKEQASGRIFIVLTMRSDFLGDCTQFQGLAEAINAGQYLVPRMTRDERRAAIERPIAVGGAEISPVLLTRLVNDVGDNPDQLSILQHALNRTWARWHSQGGKGPIDLAHYEAIGTMAHALDRHAERAYAELGGAPQQRICEILFKALTDRATDPRGVRRPTTLGTLCDIADAKPADVTEVIDIFRKPSRSFLMPPSGEVLTAAAVLDISHESLMRVWERLKTWAAEEAQSARTYRRLAETAELHAAGKAGLWRDPELQLALDWRDKNQPNEAWATRYHPGFGTAIQFLKESSDARDAERLERQQQRQRELDAVRDKADSQARYARLMLVATALSLVIAVFGILLGRWAYLNSVAAEASRAEAESLLREAQIAQSLSILRAAAEHPNDHSRAILLALETLPDTREAIDRPVVFEAQQILSKGIDQLREVAVLGGFTDPVLGVVATRAGPRIVTASTDGPAPTLNASTGAQLSRLKGDTGGVRAMTATPDGQRIITGSDDGIVRVWDAGTGLEVRRFEGHREAILGVAVTTDGTRIVTGSQDNTARVWDASTGAMILKLEGHAGPVPGVAVTSDGIRIVTGSHDNTARIWDASTGALLLKLEGHTGAVLGVAVTTDGSRMVTASDDKTARIWDTSTGLLLYQLNEQHTGPIRAVTFTPDGKRIITGSDDRTARVWDASTGAYLFELDGHTGPVLAIASTSDGSRIITSSDGTDKTVHVWDIRTDIELVQLRGDSEALTAVAAMVDGVRIITGSEDKTARIWDAGTGVQLLKLDGHTGPVRAVASTPDGKRVITGSDDRTARIWDASTGQQLLKLDGHTRPVLAVAATADGSRIVTGSSDRTARIWDASTGQQLLKLEGHTRPVLAVAATADGSRIVTGSSDGTARIWDARTGLQLLKLEGHTGTVLAVTATLDSSRIVTGSSDGTARIWDARTGAQLSKLEGHTGSVGAVAVTPDGSRVVTRSGDGTIRVWDASAMVERLRASVRDVRGIAVLPDGLRIATASGDGTARVWALADFQPPRPQLRFDTALNLQSAVEEAKRALPRCLAVKERKELRLRPAPPGWCIEMQKYPYDTGYWRAWQAAVRAGKEADKTAKDATDSPTAVEYADFADQALMYGGAIRIAKEAAELSIAFDPPPKQAWLTINLAHADMLLGDTAKAREKYLAHRGERIKALDGKLWETAILEDFKKLHDNGRAMPLMDEIRQLFKDSSRDE